MNSDTPPVVPVPPTLELLYASRVELATPLAFGQTPHGARRVIPITGGAFSGPRLSGRVLPGGADWQILRADGVAEVDARYTLETHDGALIYVRNWGLRHGPPAVMDRLAAGERVDPGEYYFRTTPVFETGADRYAWLNQVVAVAVGERRASQVWITAYGLK